MVLPSIQNDLHYIAMSHWIGMRGVYDCDTRAICIFLSTNDVRNSVANNQGLTLVESLKFEITPRCQGLRVGLLVASAGQRRCRYRGAGNGVGNGVENDNDPGVARRGGRPPLCSFTKTRIAVSKGTDVCACLPMAMRAMPVSSRNLRSAVEQKRNAGLTPSPPDTARTSRSHPEEKEGGGR